MVEFNPYILLGLCIGIAVCLILYFIIDGCDKAEGNKAKELNSEDCDGEWREIGHEK